MANLGLNLINREPDDEGLPLSGFMKPSDEPIAHPKPDGIDRFHIEDEYGAGEDEQRAAYKREGETEAEPFDAQAAALGHAAKKATLMSDKKTELSISVWVTYYTAWAVLFLYVRRPLDAKWLKYLRWGLILGGDIAGVAGAALLLGEQSIIAFLQAISVGGAAVTLGAVGREWRYLLAARARQKEPDSLTDAEKPYAQLFAGPNEGEALVKVISFCCLSGICIIATGIFALRYSTEGFMAGLAFGAIALAVGLASLANAFDVADDIAELLDNLFKTASQADSLANAAAEAAVIHQHNGALAQAKSKRAAAEAGGAAAAAGIRRLLYQALVNSPGVAGHGTKAEAADVERSSNGHKRGRSVPPPEKKVA